ncbi:MAG: AAA family ATPase [Nanoarchaeota archaeon]
MALFKDMLRSDETLFKNAVALDFDFMPKLVPFRENEQHYVATCLKPLFQKRNGRNLVITGSPGVGKTVALRRVLEELQEETDEIIPLYINCWQKNTTYKIVLEFCELLGYRFTHNKKTEELFAEIKKELNKKSAVFVFDEIDKVEEFDFLYTLIEDIYRKSILMITNYKEWVSGIDSRIKSRLIPDTLEFKQYSSREMRGILEQRMDAAFFEGAWSEEAFDAVVEHAVSAGDVRTGLFLLREAANICEDESKRQITPGHVIKASSKMEGFSIKKDTELEEETQQILQLVKEHPDKRIGDLFKLYREKDGSATYKTFQRKIQKLAENKFISIKKVIGGKEGSTTLVRPFHHKKLTEF